MAIRHWVAGSLVVLLACRGADVSRAAPSEEATLANAPASPLPSPRVGGNMSLETALASRRSQRSFLPQSLDDGTIGQVLWAAQGITDPQSGHRTAPSAGAIYPLIVFWADGRGLFRYLPQRHALTRVRTGDVRDGLARAYRQQPALGDAPAILVIVADPQRLAAKYGTLAERFAALEAGHVAQNVLLQATALGLAAVPVGGFDEAIARSVIGHAAAESTLYLIPIGRPKP